MEAAKYNDLSCLLFLTDTKKKHYSCMSLYLSVQSFFLVL